MVNAARPGAPLAVPLSWVNSLAHWRVGDARALVSELPSPALSGWGSPNQALIDEGNAWGTKPL